MGMTDSVQARAISMLIVPYLQRSAVIGRVHSVFAAAVNIEMDDGLLTVAKPSTGALPNGVVVDGDARFEVEPGALVWGGGGALRCQGLSVEMAGAEVWSPVLEPRGPFRPLCEVRAALTLAARRRVPRGGFAELVWQLADDRLALKLAGERSTGASVLGRCAPTALSQREREAIEEVMRGLRECWLDQAVDGAKRLVGRGQGLTPSGDDFLIGLMAALRAADHPLSGKFAATCWELARGRTTAVAEMFYRYAAVGAFSARIHELLAGLTDTEADLVRAFEDALEWGASSGADCVVGVLLGARYGRVV
jgi:Protein of unknown function (DUF2877)